jgi:hypothetical protein
MANYYGKTRTNYFSVADEEKFRQIIASCRASESDIEIMDEKQEDGSINYGFCCDGSIQGLPEKNNDNEITENYLEDDCDYDYDAFCRALQVIIPDNDAILITEVGSEKMCYLTGHCTVITRNDIKLVDLDNEALKVARTMLANPNFTTQNDY